MFVIQGIFTDYKQPFAITYLGASLMVVYLPIAFIKDLICSSMRKRSSKSGKIRNADIDNTFSDGLDSQNLHEKQKILEMEMQGSLTRRDNEADLAAEEERSLIAKHKGGMEMLKQDKELTTKQIALYGFYIAPVWFMTEVRYFIAALLLTCWYWYFYSLLANALTFPKIILKNKVWKFNLLSTHVFEMD